jgi:outer membrane protein assembly factor BamB
MANTNYSLKWIKYSILIIIILTFEASSIFAKTVNLTAQPFSGLSPLEVKITCYVNTGTSQPNSYNMDYGDGSPEEIIETNKYVCTFTHIYQSGFFLPKVSVEKELGIKTESDPLHVIVAKWKFKTNGEIDSSPVVGPDGTVYVGSDDGNIYAIDPGTGSLKWRFMTGAEIQSSPTVSPDGTIYFGSLDNNFYALKANGSVKWTYNIGDFIFSSPAISSNGRAVYVGASDNTIYAFNASSGTLKWKVATGGKIVSSPAIGNDGLEDVVYIGSLDRHVYALAADNGQIKWKFPTNTEVYGSPAINPNGQIYVGECNTGDALVYNYKLFCITVDGYKLWEYNGGTGFYSSPAIGPDGIIYIGSWDGTFYAIKPDGNKLWSVQTNPPRSINSSPAVGFSGRNPVLYVGAKDGNFYAFQSPEVGEGELDQRQDWIFKTGDDILYSSPTIDKNGTIYFGSHDKNLYAIQPGNMNLAEAPWPMFHKSADHSGSAQNIEIPSIISSSPSPNFNDIDINTNEIIVNFSPDIKTTQVQIDSFILKKEGTDASVIEGQAILKSKRYNNAGYHVVATFSPDDEELPLDYNTKYTASITYNPTTQNDDELTEDEAVEEASYSWSFTTEIEPEKDPNPSPESDWSCFVDSISLH